MSHPPLRIGLIALALAANIAGCARSNHSAGPTAPIVDPTADWVTVSGTVTGIDDQRPVDRDLSILVRTPGPVEERLYIEARWQYPVPTAPETIQLFTNVLQLGVGDFIVATGERTSAGVRLASLHRLDRSLGGSRHIDPRGVVRAIPVAMTDSVLDPSFLSKSLSYLYLMNSALISS